jgi:enamine deaminase RidA (YjgF/YER057c/UK114 family)
MSRAQSVRCAATRQLGLAVGADRRLQPGCARESLVFVSATAAVVGRVHGEVFRDNRPAGFIVVKGFLDPRWLVEIEADAIVSG